MTPQLKKRLILFAKIAIVFAVAVWVAWELHKSWNKIHLLAWKPDYFWLTVSCLLYIVAYLPAALFWRNAMQSLGQKPGFYETLRAYYIGHLGKYVPGKAMVVIIRSGLLRHDRTRASVAAAAVFLETLTMMAAGAFLSALLVAVWFREIQGGNKLLIAAIGMMLLAGLPILPPVFRIITKKLGVGRNDPEIDQKLKGLRFRTLGFGWLLTSVSWLLLGLSLWATIRGIGIETGPLLEHLPRFVLAASLSVVLGFVLMVPAGIGVREFAMVQVLSAYLAAILIAGGMQASEATELAPVQAMLVAAVQRGLSILGELLASLLMFRKPSDQQPQSSIENGL